jgi:hypothetical protein
VTNFAHRLNFPMNVEGARVSLDKAHRKTPRKTLSDSRQIYRKKCVETLENNPNANRNKLIKLANFEYLWLMREDSEWMEKHLPSRMKVPRKKAFFDWKKIDSEVSAKVEKVCREILNLRNPTGISITEIIKRTGCKTWLEKRNLKLSVTTKVIEENLETLETFMLKKIDLAKNKFIEEKKLPTLNQFRIRAVVINSTSENSLKIQNAVNAALIEIRSSVLL